MFKVLVQQSKNSNILLHKTLQTGLSETFNKSKKSLNLSIHESFDLKIFQIKTKLDLIIFVYIERK